MTMQACQPDGGSIGSISLGLFSCSSLSASWRSPGWGDSQLAGGAAGKQHFGTNAIQGGLAYMKHHAVPAATKTLPTMQPTPDNCADCGHSLHITAIKFGLRRARALFRCAACGWDYAER
jgi:hypothetical protein